jgi:rare lipoprotein A
MYGTTAAHKTLPLNTIVRVTNLENGKSIILKINDRGPYVGDRILDCSFGAAKKLGFDNQGTTSVEIDIIEMGDDVYMHH